MNKGSEVGRSSKSLQRTVFYFSPPLDLAVHFNVSSLRGLIDVYVAHDKRKCDQERLRGVRRLA